KGARVVIIPRNEELASLRQFRDLAGKLSEEGRDLRYVRGYQRDTTVAVGEENLLGELFMGGGNSTGYSHATHEFAHLIDQEALSEEDWQKIEEHFDNKRRAGRGVEWPDGPLTNPLLRHSMNYSATDVFEYFAQLTNAWLGTNTGIGF